MPTRVPLPPAVSICGPPASGKSTLGQVLAGRLRAALLDLDVLTGPLTAVVAGLLAEDDLDSQVLAAATRAARYETLLAGAEDNLRTGRPVVLVAPFSTERSDPAAWGRVATRLSAAGSRPLLVWLRLPDDELLRRLHQRQAPRDAAKLLAGAALLRRLDLSAPLAPHLPVDATADLDTQCGAVLAAAAR